MNSRQELHACYTHLPWGGKGRGCADKGLCKVVQLLSYSSQTYCDGCSMFIEVYFQDAWLGGQGNSQQQRWGVQRLQPHKLWHLWRRCQRRDDAGSYNLGAGDLIFQSTNKDTSLHPYDSMHMEADAFDYAKKLERMSQKELVKKILKLEENK